MNKKYALVLRTCGSNMTSRNGFVWPKEGKVECSDWDDNKECGNGLHGLLWGEGDASLLSPEKDAVWLVCKVSLLSIVDLCGKVKFPSATVVYCGDVTGAVVYLQRNGASGKSIAYSTNTGGDGSTNTGGRGSTNTGGRGSRNTGGDYSINTGGSGSINTGGYYSINTGGYDSINTGGDYSINTGGYDSRNTGGYDSINTGGRGSINTGGDCSTNTGGDYSINTGGDYSRNTGGRGSINTGGYDSINTGGDYSINTGGSGSTLVFRYWCDNRVRTAVAYVGENGIKPNVAYRLNAKYKVVEVLDSE